MPLSRGAPYLFDRTPICALLSDSDALYLANRTKPTIIFAAGELDKHIKVPTTEDGKKLDRLICYLRATRDRCAPTTGMHKRAYTHTHTHTHTQDRK